MTKIALLLAALALPAYADPPAGGASAGSDRTPAASAKTPSLGAPADDGSSQLGAKASVHADADSHAGAKASDDASSRDYRVDVDADAPAKDKAAHRVKAKAKRGKARVKASAVNKPNAGTEHAVNGGINPTPNKGVDTGASAGTGAGAGAEIDDTTAGSNQR